MTGKCKFINDSVVDIESGEIIKEQNKPTDKQMNVIRMIECNTNIRFKGNTKEDARSFITEHINESKSTRREVFKRLNEEENEGYDPRNDWGKPGTKEYEDNYYEDLADRCAFDPNW